jgi:hypothetical protein
MLGGCLFCEAHPFFAFLGASIGPSSSSAGGGGGGGGAGASAEGGGGGIASVMVRAG